MKTSVRRVALTPGTLISRQIFRDCNDACRQIGIKTWWLDDGLVSNGHRISVLDPATGRFTDEHPGNRRSRRLYKMLATAYRLYAGKLGVHPKDARPSGVACHISPASVVTVAFAALYFGRSPQTIRNLLSVHGHRFRSARYRRGQRHPRQLRLLSLSDLRRLSTILSEKTSRSQRELEENVATAFRVCYGLTGPRRRRFGFVLTRRIA
jgi:hypothetical protein